MTLITTELVDGGVLVEGTDSKGTDGTTVLRSELWNQVQEYRIRNVAQKGFDAEVAAFFKPLTDAVDAFNAKIDDDEDSVVVLDEGVKHVSGKEAEKIRLDADGVVLRILTEGDHDRLRWVGGHLVALKA